MKVGIIVACLLCCACNADSLPTYKCYRTDEPIVIDGKFDEPVWKKVPETSPFVFSCTGEKALSKTQARLCWDNARLYVAFSVEDTGIWGTLIDDDASLYDEEVVEVFLQPDPSKQAYLEFEVSPLGSIFDSAIGPVSDSPDFIRGRRWNAIGYKAAVTMEGTPEEVSETDRWWQAEIVIPFKDLYRETPKDGELWRMNLYRVNRKPTVEFQAWSPTLTERPNFHRSSLFGNLVFKDAVSK